MNETSKCRPYREQANHFNLYLKGKGIDIGCGTDKLIVQEGSVDAWDLSNGDAMLIDGVADESYDFVYSSHCLEHLKDVEVSLLNWIRIIKKGGYLYFVVPEYVLYEKMMWPPIFNLDHKQTFSYYITSDQVKRKNHYHYTDVAKILKNLGMEVLITELEDKNFNYNNGNKEDQTRGDALCQMLFVAKKEN
jgi:ubiquinone/menaquinone biosynthesis C-methylase UbiE